MSNKHATQVWSIKGVSGSERLVLVCLADFADKDGYCWPSIAVLAERCVMTDRGIQRIINRLCEYGYLEREMRSGKATIYRLTPDPQSEVTPDRGYTPTPDRGTGVPPTVDTPTPDRGYTPTPDPGDIPIKKNPHLNPQEPLSVCVRTNARVGEKNSHTGIDLTRLPIDIPDSWKAWAKKEKNWKNEIIETVWREFQEFWKTKPGRSGLFTMQAWEAKWQMRCLQINIRSEEKSQKPKAMKNVETL